MNNEIIESIFGCLERIEEKLDKQPVQTEQGESENDNKKDDNTGEILAAALQPLADSVERTNRNLCTLRDVMKIFSDRQKKDKVELLTTVRQELQPLIHKDENGLKDEIHALKHDVLDKLSKTQHKKVTHDLTTNLWYVICVGFLLLFSLTLAINQNIKLRKVVKNQELIALKYHALKMKLPVNNSCVVWLERNIRDGNKKEIEFLTQQVLNYEDSIARRREAEYRADQKEKLGCQMIKESREIRKGMR